MLLMAGDDAAAADDGDDDYDDDDHQHDLDHGGDTVVVGPVMKRAQHLREASPEGHECFRSPTMALVPSVDAYGARATGLCPASEDLQL